MSFQNKILEWYYIHERDLPWRKTKDPYLIWVSEIILQQTKVAQGIDYYYRFVKKFPSIQILAYADEEIVLKLWQGLGYYSRARNLHYSAKQIVKENQGVFPNKYGEIIKLKGIGNYTAAAISSFAFNLHYAVVDGNVVRVLSRFFGIEIAFETTNGKKTFENLANKLLPQKKSSIYNQAIMDFGALQCTPKSPNCINCPLQEDCIALNTGLVKTLPVKKKKKKVQNRYLHYLVINAKEGICIKKRLAGIWKGLYEFPFLEFNSSLSPDNVKVSSQWIDFFKGYEIEVEEISEVILHKLTHQKINARFWKINIKCRFFQNYIHATSSQLKSYPVSKLIHKYLSRISFNTN